MTDKDIHELIQSQNAEENEKLFASIQLRIEDDQQKKQSN